ncbi:hypothetical protein AMATHDRAFT_71908 [Amanita thiersii Skay4041]|uniref:Peptidase M43 pregnancy-associated plasma-A domain-containing protein n=1 Tax=Amanita thiersii Skay4041 TaxID=703135 RepID=A0A2A9N658_9AGAR|nr:hypothetical protein AMATHDRAFT_71908 [Amanita thiersii Skay4041]
MIKLLTLLLCATSVLADAAKSLCGTYISEEAKVAAEAQFRANKVESSLVPGAYTPASLNIYFHIIHPDHSGSTDVSQATLKEQMRIINIGFSDPKIHWKLGGVTHTVNPNWYRMRVWSSDEVNMKAKLRQGGAADLNVYVVGRVIDGDMSRAGYSTFPWDYPGNPQFDGVLLAAWSLPGGELPYNLGHSLTHEAGHWVGLLHPFQGGCYGDGDFVADTPAEGQETYGCPTNKDTCRGGGPDPIHNYMDYSDDTCKNHFTKGQIKRLRDQIATFRGIPW